MLVWDENHRNGQPSEVALLIKRDRNHPSIVIWSLCNEVLCDSDDKVGDGRIAEGVIRTLDPLGGRPISANNNGLNGKGTILDVRAPIGPLQSCNGYSSHGHAQRDGHGSHGYAR